MIGRIIEIEAESLDAARQQLRSQMPEGSYLLSERVISDGTPVAAKAVADTTEAAFAQARREIPSNAAIVEEKELQAPARKLVPIHAFNEPRAESKARSQARSHLGGTATVAGLRLVDAGRKGFLGIGAKRNRYIAELIRQAIAQVTYRPKPKVSFEVASVASLIAALRDKDRTMRHAAAQALVSLYRSGQLSAAHKNQVLSYRNAITASHRDVRGAHTDDDRHTDRFATDTGCVHRDEGGHTDRRPHTDSGIGVDFPL